MFLVKVLKEEMFEQAQKLLKQRYMKPSKAKHPYLLTGLLRCGLCKGRMFGYIYRKTNTKYYLYYRCQNCISKGRTVCKGMLVPAEIVEKAVVDTVLSISRNKQFLSDKALLLKTLKQEAKPPKEKLEDKKKSLLQEEKKLIEIRDTLLEKLENKVLDDAVFNERFSENKKKLEIVRDNLSKIALQGHEANLQEIALNASYEELCNLPVLWNSLTDEEKRDKLRTIINQAVVNYDKRAGKANIKLELFVDSISQKKREKFHSVVFPLRRGMGS
jgi:site-specific DNA recombinase